MSGIPDRGAGTALPEGLSRGERGGPFTDAEIVGRLDRLRVDAAAAGLDGLVLTSWPGLYHATGAPIFQFGRPAAALVPVDGPAVIVASIIEIEHVRAQSPVEDVRTYHDFGVGPAWDTPQPPLASLITLLAAATADRGLDRARLGVEEASLPVREHDALAAGLPAATLVAASDIVDRQRLVKSDAELGLIRAAGVVVDDGMEAMLTALRAGTTARELHEAARAAMLEALLARHPGVPFHLRVDTGLGAVARGAGHSEWAGWDAMSRAGIGDVLVLIADCVLWGYTGNVERTVVIGEPALRVRADFETMVRANEAAIAIVRPGVTPADIDAACKRVLADAGHGTRTGSGVGRGTISYEGGWRELLLDLRGYNTQPLQPGACFSLEPDLATPDGTYRHCDTITVTDGGCEVASRVRRDVIWVA